MKILMVIPTFAPIVGGAERQLEGVTPALVQMGCSVTVLTRRLPGTPDRDLSLGYPVRRLPTWGLRFGFHLSLLFYLLARGRRYDIIHCHTLSGPAAICSLSGALLDRPVLVKVTRSGPGSQIRQWSSSRFRRAAFKLLLQRYSRFVAISKDTQAELRRMGIAEDRVSCVPNGVAVPADAHPGNSRRPQIVYTGRLIPRKRVDLLLRAFASTRQARNCSLLVIGDGPMRSELEKLASDKGIDNAVGFTGELRKERLREHLRASDIFVLPSQSEGMSNSLLEAMSEGLAVIAADIQASRELIEHNETGLLFDSESTLSLQLDMLLEDAELRRKLGSNARARIKRQYSFETIAMSFGNIYRSMVSS